MIATYIILRSNSCLTSWLYRGSRWPPDQGSPRHVDIRPQIAGMLDQAPTGLEPVPEPLEDA